MKICIDPGHGGRDGGAASGNLIEKHMTLVTANALAAFLKEQGHTVMLTRSTDIYVTIGERASAANAWGAQMLISVHYNAGGGDRAEALVSAYKHTDADRRLSAAILAALQAIGQTQIKTATRANSTGTADYFGIIRLSNCPTLIVEPCFIDHASDRTLADTTAEQQAIGVAIGRGILNYLGQKEAVKVSAKDVYKKIIQGKCNFSNPDVVWGLLDKHPYAESLYRKWAESYK